MESVIKNDTRSLRTVICLVLVFAYYFGGRQPIYASSDETSDSNAAIVGTKASLNNYLLPDGSLNLNSDYDGNLDMSGWKMTLAANGEPHFFQNQNPVQPEEPESLINTWEAVATIATMDNFIISIVLFHGEIYLAGQFTNLNNNPSADYIARWNGSNWLDVGGGLNNYAYSMLVSGKYLYVGGQFTDAGGNANADRFARWDGTSWAALSTSFTSGYVYEIAEYGHDIYATSTDSPYLFRWNGSTWSSIPGISSQIMDITADGSYLYAAGIFTNAGGDPNADRVARWNGSQWEALGNGLDLSSNFVRSIAVAGEHVYVGGGFTDANGNPDMDYLAHWDGAGWQAVPGVSSAIPNGPSPIEAVRIAGGSIYVAGTFDDMGGLAEADTIARWDGKYWHALGTGLNGYINTNEGIFIDGSDVYAIGYFFDAGGDPDADYLARWDGSEATPIWNAVGFGLNGVASALVQVGPDLYVGGSFTDAGSNPNADRIARWDGHLYHALGSGIPNGTVNAIAVSGKDVYVGGNFTNAGGNPNADYIVRWDGTTWQALGSGLNSAVTALLFYGPNLYVGGDFTDAGGNAAGDKIARWDGSSWNPLGNGKNDTVYGLAAYGRDLVVGGQFTASGDGGSSYMARWDGTNWGGYASSAINGGWVNALSVSSGYLYIGGNFLELNSNGNLARLARYDGATWVGSGLNNGFVLCLDSNSYEVAVGGSFTVNGGFFQHTNVIKWTGEEIQFYGLGLNGVVTAVKMVGPDVFWGGFFEDNGGNEVIDHISRWGTRIRSIYLPVIQK